MRAPSCPALPCKTQPLLGTSLPSLSLHSVQLLSPHFSLAPLYSPGAGRWHGDSSQQKQALAAGPASGPWCLLGTHS